MSAPGNTGYYSWKFSLTYLAHVFKAVFNLHHRELLPAFTRILRKDSVVIDVGAHAGQFAKLFSGISPQGTVFALEPGSYARSILRAAVALNRINNIVVLPFGLGATAGSGILLVPEKRKGSYGFGLSHIKGKQDGIETKYPVKKDLVSITTLDILVEQLALPRVDFIKMDIEGWELQALAGARETLKRHQPGLYIELNNDHLKRAGDTLQAAWFFLNDMGYTPYHFCDAEQRFKKVTDISDGDWWWFTLPP